ncbi:hypothetical protein F4821DRAFT_65096 [Hypoxylon rubiginosum]|uniref:Uncharacterized protein n=1 Tax=Hypoxylon rubiginosum TaxID=110542 RepID=A0ACC0D8L2_9PEZI|nr:hypothetical protein F4821DRAFT_65096 [Hypoxylon rubiginosum]
MYSTRLVHLLMVALGVSQAMGVAWINPHQGGYQVKRQDDDVPLSIGTDIATGSAAADPTSSSTDEATSSSTTSPDSTTSETPTSTSDTPTSTPTSTSTTADNNTPTSTDATPTSTPNGPTSTPATTTSNGSPTSTPASTTTGGGGDSQTTTESAETTEQPVTSTFVTVITSTDAAGQTFVTSSSSTVVSTPTSAADSSDQTSGMPKSTQNTIIGVCVGVGGAIILAAAGVLIYRLRSKRRNADESEELVSYGDGFSGPGAAEKSDVGGSSTATRTPFQSTLESYHAPSQTNAASNF